MNTSFPGISASVVQPQFGGWAKRRAEKKAKELARQQAKKHGTRIAKQVATKAASNTKLGKFATAKSTRFNDLIDMVPVIGDAMSLRNGYKLIKLGRREGIQKRYLLAMGAVTAADLAMDALVAAGVIAPPSWIVTVGLDALIASNTINRKIFEHAQKKQTEQNSNPFEKPPIEQGRLQRSSQKSGHKSDPLDLPQLGSGPRKQPPAKPKKSSNDPFDLPLLEKRPRVSDNRDNPFRKK